jgi:AcrR family transcriptional regulator
LRSPICGIALSLSQLQHCDFAIRAIVITIPAMARRVPNLTTTTSRRAPVRTHVPSEQRRAQILEAAAALFAQHGFAGTTTKQIASAVGATETVLFRLFPTKDSLYAAILEQQVPMADVERWLEGLRSLAERRDDEALFAAVVRAVVGSYRTNRVYHRLMLFAALENHELARLGQIKHTRPVASFLRDYISLRQKEGAFRRIRPEVVVHMLLSVAGHFAMWKALGVNPLGLTEREVAKQAVALIAGLRRG